MRRFAGQTVTFTGSAQRLSTDDTETLNRIEFHVDPANTMPCYVGYSDAVTSAAYAVRLPAPDGQGEPPPPWLIEFDDRHAVALSDIYVIGTLNEKVHISYIRWRP